LTIGGIAIAGDVIGETTTFALLQPPWDDVGELGLAAMTAFGSRPSTKLEGLDCKGVGGDEAGARTEN
jgi:hypothetical protein